MRRAARPIDYRRILCIVLEQAPSQALSSACRLKPQGFPLVDDNEAILTRAAAAPELRCAVERLLTWRTVPLNNTLDVTLEDLVDSRSTRLPRLSTEVVQNVCKLLR